ncbi:MAG TPA: hypothetical protein VI431_07685 [Candidatus Acidoferrum sp.]
MPTFPLDPDMAVFLATVGRILLGSMAQLQRNVAPIPKEYEFEEVPLASLTREQQEFFAPYDKQLLAMEYRPLFTYRVRNYGSNLIRRYVNPMDRASCTVIAVEVKTRVDGVLNKTLASNVSFYTVFADGKELTTRNMRVRTVLDHPPEFIIQECPYERDLSVLKKRHDARAAKLGVPLAAEMSMPRVFAFYQDQHRRFSEFQVERGTYKRTLTGYVVSKKAFWRGIRNYLVPFAERFSTMRLLIAGIVAIGLPSVTYSRLLPGLLPSLVPFLSRARLDAGTSSLFILGASYVIAGACVGLLLEKGQFIWGFLFTFVGVHLVTGWWLSPIPFGLIAGTVSHAVAQLRMRRAFVPLATEAH